MNGHVAILASLSMLAPMMPVARAAQAPETRPMLTAKLSRWEGDPAKKRKGPPGFDIQFRLVGARFDGTFGMEGLPQTVPEGEAFDAQVKLTNIGTTGIKIASVTVTGGNEQLPTDVLVKQVDPKSATTVASFKVPAQTAAGGSFLITVVLSNGDKHRATLSFTKAA
jgi:hypothetical protein